MFIPRPILEKRILTAREYNPAVLLLGPRQCGKTTIARKIAEKEKAEYFDLENPLDLARLSAPMLALEKIRGLTVIDEAQRKPELFDILRVLIDDPDCHASFLLLGSASPHLVRGVSESLAGRVSIIHMSGFDTRETGPENFSKLWGRGGFPRSFLAPDEIASFEWRTNFIRTFLERDIPQLGITVPSATLRRFWTMLAHYHGQVWNASEFARSLGSSQKTASRYLDILTDSFVVRQLQPWHENIKKRQVKAPKIYIKDSGLLHALLNLKNAAEVQQHPKLGASWEGFVIEQTAAVAGTENLYFWATHGGAELDILMFQGGKRIGIEIKYADAPSMTKSMHIALKDLGLDKLYIIYPGRTSYDLADNVSVLSFIELDNRICSQGTACAASESGAYLSGT